MENKEIQEKPKKKKVVETEELKAAKETEAAKERKAGFKENKGNLDYLKEINGNYGYNDKACSDHYQTKTLGFGMYYDEERFQKYEKGGDEIYTLQGDRFGIPCVQEIIHKIYLLKGYFLHHIDKFQLWLPAIHYATDDMSTILIIEEMEQLFEANKDKNSDLHKLFIKLFRIASHIENMRRKDNDKFNYRGNDLYQLNYGTLSHSLIEGKREYTKEKLLKNIEEEGPDVPHNFLQKIYIYLIKNHGDKIIVKKEEEIVEEIVEEDEK